MREVIYVSGVRYGHCQHTVIRNGQPQPCSRPLDRDGRCHHEENHWL